jgi:hypothetical protein
MTRGKLDSTTTLTLLLPIGALAAMAMPGSANAATPTYYNGLPAFQADVTSTVTDDYQNPGYVFLQGNAAMNAVIGQTDYMTTGFLDWNIVSGGVYCAGCNGSFQLSFQTTTVGTAAGVNGVGMNIQFNDPGTPYFAYITFADGTIANIQLPGAGSFWGVAAPERIQSIHFGLSMGGVTQGGSFGIDNLIVGDGNIGGCMVAGDCVDDMNPCTDAVCNANLCQYVPNVAPCDDGNPCTDDACGGGVCQGQFNTAPCDDLEVCTENDACANGLCQGALVSCEDGNECTTNFCDFGVGCDSVSNNNPCDDANACTEGDACAAGSCSGTSMGCDDADPCTADSCDPDQGCVSDPIAGCCTDDAGCSADETCDPDTNTCVPTSGSSGGGESTDGGESTGTPADTGVDDSGGGGSSGATTGGTAGLDTGTAGSTGADTGSGFDPGATPDFSACDCATTPSPQQRLWWLMVPLGAWLRRRRRAA